MVVVGGGSGGRSWSLAAVGIGGVAGYTWWKGWWRFDQVMPVNKAQFNEGIGQLRRIATAIPGADLLTDVTAEYTLAVRFPQHLGHGPWILDGRVGDTPGRVEPVGIDESVRRTRIEAGAAAPAVVGLRRVGFQVEFTEQLT